MPALVSLPERKQKYVRNRAKGLTQKEAARRAGYAPSTAAAASARIETPDVKAVFRDLVQRALPPKALVDTLREGLVATQVQRASCDGKFTDQATDPDYRTRKAYLELAAEYGGYVSREADAPQLHLHVDRPVNEQPVVDSLKPVIDIPTS